MKITKYKSGRESYDFKVNRKDLVKLLTSVIENNKGYNYWLPTGDGKQVKLIIEESK